MSKGIPNQNAYICFLPSNGTWVDAIPAYNVSVLSTLVPTAAEVASAVVLTPLVVGLNASVTGSTVPTPAFDTLFNRTIPGTQDAQFTADFYRDSLHGSDLAWNTLPLLQYGFFIISRFGGSGTNRIPIVGDYVETWPVVVTARAMQQMTTNTVQMFTVTCAVPQQANDAGQIAS